MGYRTGLDIKLNILDELASRPYVLNELERRIDTNGRVLRRHLEELVTLGLVCLQKRAAHARNGQRYTVAQLNPSLPQEQYESIRQQNERRKQDPSRRLASLEDDQ